MKKRQKILGNHQNFSKNASNFRKKQNFFIKFSLKCWKKFEKKRKKSVKSFKIKKILKYFVYMSRNFGNYFFFSLIFLKSLRFSYRNFLTNFGNNQIFWKFFQIWKKYKLIFEPSSNLGNDRKVSTILLKYFGNFRNYC